MPAVTAAAADDEPADAHWWALGAFAVVVVGFVLAVGVNALRDPSTLVLRDGVTVFALFYVAAQAVERLLEPFSTLILPAGEARKEMKVKVAEALSSPPEAVADKVQEAAAAKGEYDKLRFQRALVFWAAASFIGMLLSGFLGLYFVGTLVAVQPGGEAVPAALDIAVTGLVIGGGTKPLHDLITRIQSAKEDAEDPPETR